MSMVPHEANDEQWQQRIGDYLGIVVKKHWRKMLWGTMTAALSVVSAFTWNLWGRFQELERQQLTIRAELKSMVQGELAQVKDPLLRELKPQLDEARSFMDAYELLDILRTHNDARRYDEANRTFHKASAHIACLALRKQIYAEALRSHSVSGAYYSLSHTQLEDIEASLKVEFPCSLVSFHLACVLAGRGNLDKARATCLAAMNRYAESCERSVTNYSCRPLSNAEVELTDYRALLVLIELAKSDRVPTNAVVLNSWAVLDECARRGSFVQTKELCERIDASALRALCEHLSTSASFVTALHTMKSQLRQYVYMPEPSIAAGRNRFKRERSPEQRAELPSPTDPK